MPLYEYTCPKCRSRFEVLQRVGEGADDLACPRCGGAQPLRELSTFTAFNAVPAAPSACGPSGCCGCGS